MAAAYGMWCLVRAMRTRLPLAGAGRGLGGPSESSSSCEPSPSELDSSLADPTDPNLHHISDCPGDARI